MSSLTQFEARVLQGGAFQLADSNTLRVLCPFAEPFATWCEQLVAGTRERPTDVTVNLALLNLQTKYWSWYERAPTACRNHIGTRSRKVCLFQIYRDAYTALRDVECLLTPPRLREVSPSASIVQVPALYLGYREE